MIRMGIIGSMMMVIAGSAAGQGGAQFRMIEELPDGWLIEYTPGVYAHTSVDIDGRPHMAFVAGATDLAPEGEPLLPVDVLTMGIPFDAALSADLEDVEFDIVPNQWVAPSPRYEYNDNGEAVEHYEKSPVAYARNAFFPPTQIAAGLPHTLRQQRVAAVRILPYQYNPAAHSLRRILRASIRIRLIMGTGGEHSLRTPRAVDEHFESVYRKTVWNHDQARQWRREVMALDSGPDPTRDWFETGREYYRAKIWEDGWYKVTRADLVAAGANPAQIDPVTLKVFFMGGEIPIVVRPDTTIEFHAVKNYGDSTYIHWYTDTSSYWITWGGQPGLRFAPTSQHTDPPSSVIRSARASKHFERNTAYYYGTGTYEISQNEQVPGEGWLWTYFFQLTSTTFPFDIDSVDHAAAMPCTLRVRLQSTTPDFPGPDHRVDFWVNDSTVGQLLFDGRTQATYTAPIPLQWLANGTNSLRIRSDTTQSFPNSFYLDWFVIDYPRLLRPVADYAAFEAPLTIGPAEFRVTGFTGPLIEVYDLDTRRQITGGTISGGGQDGYSIAFRDTVSIPRTYIVTGAAAARPVAPLQRKLFTDIRVNPQGADYIIVSHSDFLPYANQLAAHRQAFNGMRVMVVDVQDIYDEFHYGVTDAAPIKRFLRHAYEQWPAPAPVYLLFMGDASWDYRKYLSTTIKNNFIPAYGQPAGDNWYGSFDPAFPFLPSLLIGRLPVYDPIQAERTVQKIIQYDFHELDHWNKSFMMITGGTTTSEQASFNSLTEWMISTWVDPPPLGGTAHRVYKASGAVVDGEHKTRMKELVREGVGFVNFLGHSGGRIWGVDIGSPNELENTNGRLPYISSTSCNVGAFAEPSSNVLSEDFVLADNRGAIGMWASSSLGYPSLGTGLTAHFLAGVTVDSARAFGELTTTARYRLWQSSPNDWRVVAMAVLNPLIGDPLSALALPLKADLAITDDDISLDIPMPTPNDSSVTVKAYVRNFGLVPPDSVEVSLFDTYDGTPSPILNAKRIRPIRHRDSITVSWDMGSQVGRHTLQVSLDPNNLLQEVSEVNNSATSVEYVYANLLAIVKPLLNMVVAPGVQTLVVTSPVGVDSVGFQYFFELDTVDSFDSPLLMSSGPVAPGLVSGEWTTPPLPEGRVYFWRARTQLGETVGKWVVSSFSTSTDLPPVPLARRKEASRKQFARSVLTQAAATDSGVTIGQRPPISLIVRSWGTNGTVTDRYAKLIINETTFWGYWWHIGYSFMALRINEFDGSFVFREFPLTWQAVQADSMTRFINTTPVGNYLAFAVIQDGRTNVTESLYVALESLGSTMVRQLQYGHSWGLIARKGSSGPGMTAIEGWRPDSLVELTFEVPNYYSSGAGSVAMVPMTIPTAWNSFHWRPGLVQGVTDVRVGLLGVRSNGVADTLRILPADTTDVDLAFMNPLTSGPTYTAFKAAGLLTSTDATLTPTLREWWVDFVPPADLAVSSRTVGIPDATVERGSVFNLPVGVHNIGFAGIDSARLVVSVYDKFNKARPVASAMVDTIPVNGSASTIIAVPTNDFPRLATLQVAVSPSKKYKDLVPENNTAYYTLQVTGSHPATVRLYADGVQLMDGDYIAGRPELLAQAPQGERSAPVHRQFQLLVNGVGVPPVSVAKDEAMFSPELPSGRHELALKMFTQDAFGEVDSAHHAVSVYVENESRIVRMFNYPNPFSRETEFTFELTGIRPPEELAIRIYTVAGRKIKEITLHMGELRIGFNRVRWDGRDADGAELANGYYFYRMTLKGERNTDSAIGKLVKVR